MDELNNIIKTHFNSAEDAQNIVCDLLDAFANAMEELEPYAGNMIFQLRTAANNVTILADFVEENQ